MLRRLSIKRPVFYPVYSSNLKLGGSAPKLFRASPLLFQNPNPDQHKSRLNLNLDPPPNWETIREYAKEIEMGVMKRIKMRNSFYFRICCIAVLLLILFSKKIKEHFGSHTADVAALTLEDKKVVEKAQQLTNIVTSQILTDKATHDLVVTLLVQLLNDEESIKEIYQLAINVVNDPTVQGEVTALTNSLVHQLLDDEKVKDHTKRWLSDIFSDQRVIEDCGKGLSCASWHAFYNAMPWLVIPVAAIVGFNYTRR